MASVKISALTAASFVAAANEFAINEAGSSKKVTAAQLSTYVAAAKETVVVLGADHSIASATATEITGLRATLASAGTYIAEYFLLAQSAVAGTGLGFGLNYSTGTKVLSVLLIHAGTGANATTGIMDDEANLLTGNMLEARATNTVSGTTPNMLNEGVAVINKNTLVQIVVHLVIDTGGGYLGIWHGSQDANTTVVKAGSHLLVRKVA